MAVQKSAEACGRLGDCKYCRSVQKMHRSCAEDVRKMCGRFMHKNNPLYPLITSDNKKAFYYDRVHDTESTYTDYNDYYNVNKRIKAMKEVEVEE